MPAASQLEMEQTAYQALLDSGYLQRAPSLRRIFIYICTQYFEGKAEEIKEYNIAVEALGKPPQFDQKESSVVRVEVHRLRKRLQQYYATVGAGAAVEISIPEGSYVPLFVPRQALTTVGSVEVTAAEKLPVVELRKHERSWMVGFAIRAAAVVIALGAVAIWVETRYQERATAARQPAPVEARGTAITGTDGVIRILAG